MCYLFVRARDFCCSEAEVLALDRGRWLHGHIEVKRFTGCNGLQRLEFTRYPVREIIGRIRGLNANHRGSCKWVQMGKNGYFIAIGYKTATNG